jgi:hypothetical protein
VQQSTQAGLLRLLEGTAWRLVSDLDQINCSCGRTVPSCVCVCAFQQLPVLTAHDTHAP